LDQVVLPAVGVHEVGVRIVEQVINDRGDDTVE